MKAIKLIVKTETQKYPIIIGSNFVSTLGSIIKNNSIQTKRAKRPATRGEADSS